MKVFCLGNHLNLKLTGRLLVYPRPMRDFFKRRKTPHPRKKIDEIGSLGYSLLLMKFY
jgi:hypothetical protein